jgi:hypothetical protein
VDPIPDLLLLIAPGIELEVNGNWVKAIRCGVQLYTYYL